MGSLLVLSVRNFAAVGVVNLIEIELNGKYILIRKAGE
jgi:hypothetical protein